MLTIRDKQHGPSRMTPQETHHVKVFVEFCSATAQFGLWSTYALHSCSCSERTHIPSYPIPFATS